MPHAPHREQREQLSLSDAAKMLTDECRMVLPGIQALFGFQLIVVFNERFARDLERTDQLLHMVAIALVAVAVALVMTPAAFHRAEGSRQVTDTYIHVCSVLLLTSMVPLAAGLSLDFHLIAKLVFGSEAVAVACGTALFALLMAFWFVFPHFHGLHRRLASLRQHVRSH